MTPSPIASQRHWVTKGPVCSDVCTESGPTATWNVKLKHLWAPWTVRSALERGRLDLDHLTASSTLRKRLGAKTSGGV